MMHRTSRAEFLRISAHVVASAILMRPVFAHHALGANIKPLIISWRKELEALRADLREHRLTPLEWQSRIEQFYARIPLVDLLDYLDFERLASDIALPDRGAAHQTIDLAPIEGLPDRIARGHKIFGLRKGAAIIPHAHNNMVSAHFVLKGQFRVRTYHRRFDLEGEAGYLTIEPARDQLLGAGALLTMSDDRDNIHWLVAESEAAYTLDLPITNLNPDKTYPHRGNRYSMIFVDPERPSDSQGLIRAPILDLETAMARFGLKGFHIGKGLLFLFQFKGHLFDAFLGLPLDVQHIMLARFDRKIIPLMRF